MPKCDVCGRVAHHTIIDHRESGDLRRYLCDEHAAAEGFNHCVDPAGFQEIVRTLDRIATFIERNGRLPSKDESTDLGVFGSFDNLTSQTDVPMVLSYFKELKNFIEQYGRFPEPGEGPGTPFT
jgi:hypothetical protein